MANINLQKDVDGEKKFRKDQFNRINSKHLEALADESDSIYKFLLQKNILQEKCLNNKSLELGCGFGPFTFKMASVGYNITGTDISQEQIDFNNMRCKKNNLPKMFTVLDMNSMNSIKDESFDYVFLIQVLHHFKKIDVIFDELFRVLKTNGKVIILESNTSNILRLILAIVLKIDIDIFHLKLHLAPHLNEGFHLISTYKKYITKYGNFTSYPYCSPAIFSQKEENKHFPVYIHYILFSKLLSSLSFPEKYYAPTVFLVGEKIKTVSK